MDIEKEFVTYEIALKLKELDFDEECFCTYDSKGDLRRNPSNGIDTKPIKGQPYTWKNSLIHNSVVTAPLWQQVIDWLRKKYNLHIRIDLFKKGWTWNLTNLGDWIHLYPLEQDFYKTYEESRDKSILKIIELINEKSSDEF